tara:strand:- start:189 stop:431 length:243 start_codon:yes stop_codon:yes gene_type:complete
MLRFIKIVILTYALVSFSIGLLWGALGAIYYFIASVFSVEVVLISSFVNLVTFIPFFPTSLFFGWVVGGIYIALSFGDTS